MFLPYVGLTLLSSTRAWGAWLEHGSRKDLSTRTSDIATPVSGADGAAIDTQTVEREVVNCIADVCLTSVPNARHLLPFETPEVIARLIRAHVSSGTQ
jgi:hypothetical protein